MFDKKKDKDRDEMDELFRVLEEQLRMAMNMLNRMLAESGFSEYGFRSNVKAFHISMGPDGRITFRELSPQNRLDMRENDIIEQEKRDYEVFTEDDEVVVIGEVDADERDVEINVLDKDRIEICIRELCDIVDLPKKIRKDTINYSVRNGILELRAKTK